MARRLLEHKRINYVSIDWLMMGFNTGIPEYGIHHLLFPDDIARRIWPFLKGMIESMIYVEEDCVIEGEAVLPELVIELTRKFPDTVKVCFLGYKNARVAEKVAEIKKYSSGDNDWLTNESDAYIIDHTENMIEHSKMIQNSCVKYGFRYFDTSNQFEEKLEEAAEYLFS